MVNAVDLLAEGEPADIPGIKRHDEIGSVGRSLETISKKGLEAARLRSALDSCSTMVMVANRQGNINYVNPALDRMLKSCEPEIRKQAPSFDVSNLMGAGLGTVHNNLSQVCAAAETQGVVQEADIAMGSRRLHLTISPVTNGSGTYLGAVVEWMDRTVELAMQGEIDRIINAAREGNLREKSTFMVSMALIWS